MGEFKPLLRIGSKTLIEHTVDSMFAGGITELTVTLGYRAGEVEQVLRSAWPADKVCIAINHRYAETDMLASVKTGLRVLMSAGFTDAREDAFFLLPGDMPAVSKETFRALAGHREKTMAKLIFPVAAGKRGHPPLISAVCVPDILDYEGAEGLRGFWRRRGGEELEVKDRGCLLDADTMENYHELAAYMQERMITIR
jgi:CTP:molybdopterin cytidylyltransferase MocA